MFTVRLWKDKTKKKRKDKTNPGIVVDTYKCSTPETEAIASQI